MVGNFTAVVELQNGEKEHVRHRLLSSFFPATRRRPDEKPPSDAQPAQDAATEEEPKEEVPTLNVRFYATPPQYTNPSACLDADIGCARRSVVDARGATHADRARSTAPCTVLVNVARRTAQPLFPLTAATALGISAGLIPAGLDPALLSIVRPSGLAAFGTEDALPDTVDRHRRCAQRV
ncbi:hypothetical protein FB451DRAFT_1394981 [Mycena latifolia]|nr:hypothetical protein FB451DRAFT_1394981 [Mycena latifolia]